MNYWALRALVEIGGRLPVRVSYALAGAAGTAKWYASRSVRETTRDHIRHVLGPGASRRRVDSLARSCARANMFYFADFARFGLDDEPPIFDFIDEVVGLGELFDAVDEGRGVILVGAHLGNGEVIARAAAPFGLCIAIVTERLSPPRVHEYVHRMRAARGVQFFPADMTGLRSSLAHLKHRGTLGLLIDRDVLGTGEPFPFFGERAPMPSGPVDLARRTGAPMFGAWMPRTGPGRYALHLERIELPEPTGDRAADVESGMRAMVGALESAIRRWPGQWFATSPVWRDQP